MLNDLARNQQLDDVLMKTLLSSILVIVFTLIFSIVNAFDSTDSDSSRVSSIQFGELHAVVSSRIVHFKWEVDWENNGDYFVIEKSIDSGESWTQIAKVKSLENHKERHTYEISEINMAQEAVELFRISRIDSEGDQEVLDFVDINHPILSNIKLIQDPKRVNKSITVSWESMIESRGFISIYNEKGDLKFYDNLTLSDGYNRLELVTKGFDPGRYTVVVKNEFDDGITKTLVIH